MSEEKGKNGLMSALFKKKSCCGSFQLEEIEEEPSENPGKPVTENESENQQNE